MTERGGGQRPIGRRETLFTALGRAFIQLALERRPRLHLTAST
jgi:hypothetical protein